MSPKGFTVMGSHNLIVLVCELMLLQRKRERNPKVQWILWNSLLQDVSETRKAQKDGVYAGVSNIVIAATACAKNKNKN